MFNTLSTGASLETSQLSGTLVMGKCAPSNDILSPLAGPFETLIGAVNGLMPWFVAAVAVGIIIVAVFAMKSDRVAGWLKSLAFVLMVPVAGTLLLMVYFVIMKQLENMDACPF